MHSMLMKSLVTVSIKICSIFAMMIEKNVLILMNSKERLDLLKSKTIHNFKYQNFPCRFMCLFTKSWWTFHLVDLISMHSQPKIYLKVHRVISIKIHLHHSHITGKVLGYAHDFCNMKVREDQNQFSCIAHNFFGFDMFFLLKGIWLSLWGTNDLNIGGSGLINIISANLGSWVKFINTMKYYLLSLGSRDSTLGDVEKMHVKKLTLQFLNQHDFFLRIWPLLDFSQKRKVLDIIVSGKRVIPY